MHCQWENKLVQPPWKTVWKFLKKLKIELPYDPAIPLLGIHPKKTKTLIQKGIWIGLFVFYDIELHELLVYFGD